ncbi:hypothetical protein EDC04DRAFT_2566342 [Pisolithus marmoratus]|nr:hypothetical protein EDC04DRAFT_2566342 [Pisolithus marmoratus]
MQDPLCKQPETHPPSQGDPVSDTAPNVPPSTHSFGPLSTAERLQLVRGKRQREPCHHGLSRNALSLKKTLWDSRLDKWRALYSQASAWQHPATRDFAPPTNIPSSGLERDIPQRASRWYAYDLQSPIYPRAGDIPALRDPHAVELDKSFFEYPLWTIQKALYLFDMYDRFTRPLVATNTGGMEIQPCSTHTPELAYVDSNPGKQTDARSHTFPPETMTWDDVRPWEWDWYQRWAVLENLVQRSDQSSPGSSSPLIEAMESSSESDSSYPCKSRSVQSTWEDGDEEDYGTLAANCALFSKRFVDEWE